MNLAHINRRVFEQSVSVRLRRAIFRTIMELTKKPPTAHNVDCMRIQVSIEAGLWKR